MTGIQCALFDFLHELLADGIIKQGIFIGKVRIKRGAVDLRLIGHILHGDGFESLFCDETMKRFKNQASGPFDAGIQFFSSFKLDNILSPVLLIQQIQLFDG